MRRYSQTMSAAPLRVSPFKTGRTAALGGATTLAQLVAARGLPQQAAWIVATIARRWGVSANEVLTRLLALERRTGLPLETVAQLAHDRPVVSRQEMNDAIARFGDGARYLLRVPGQAMAERK